MFKRPILLLLIVVLGLMVVVRYNRSYRETPSEVITTTLNSGLNELSVSIDNLTRPYILYIPNTYKPENPTPLVLFFHGGGGDMNQALDYNLQDTAEEKGFVVAFLNGTSAFRNNRLATWNAGDCCGYARDNNIDDVGYIKSVITDIENHLNVNKGMIFATGMSNGGIMSYRLACEMSDTFSAIAAVAGTDNTRTCNPTQPISILHIHALDDDHVLFNGGAGAEAFKDETKVTEFTSVPETINRWLKHNHITTPAVRTFSVTGAYCDTYTGVNNIDVTLCVTETGGHSWPGSHLKRIIHKKNASQAIDANTIIWDFFSTHHR